MEHKQAILKQILTDEVQMIQRIENICYNMSFCFTSLETMYDAIACTSTIQTIGTRRHLFLNVPGRFVESRFPYQL